MARRIAPAKLSRWYQQLSQQLSAGVGFASALRESAGPPGSDLLQLSARLEAGDSVDRVLDEAPAWLPTADRFLLSAAAQSGRLAEVTAQLSTHHRTLQEQRKALIGAAFYPVFVLHFALLSLPLAHAIGINENGGFEFHLEGYLSRAAGSVALLWMALWVVREGTRRLPRLTQRTLRFLPGLRKYSRARGLSRFAWSLEALLNAGVLVGDAIGGAAIIADDRSLTPAVLKQMPQLEAGATPSQLLASIPVFPVEFTSLYQTGERTGQLDVTLERLAQRYDDEARDGLKWATFWYPKLLFMIVASLIGAAVSQVYAEYLGSLDQFF